MRTSSGESNCDIENEIPWYTESSSMESTFIEEKCSFPWVDSCVSFDCSQNLKTLSICKNAGADQPYNLEDSEIPWFSGSNQSEGYEDSTASNSTEAAYATLDDEISSENSFGIIVRMISRVKSFANWSGSYNNGGFGDEDMAPRMSWSEFEV